ncbi:MAG: WbqC family protein [Hymenobacter sp.]
MSAAFALSSPSCTYLPSIAFFQQVLAADALLLDAHEHYRKQTYRNRCLILTAQGVAAAHGAGAGWQRGRPKSAPAKSKLTTARTGMHRHSAHPANRLRQPRRISAITLIICTISTHRKPARLLDLNLDAAAPAAALPALPLPLQFTARLPRPTSPNHSLTTLTAADRRDFLTPKAASALRT